MRQYSQVDFDGLQGQLLATGRRENNCNVRRLESRDRFAFIWYSQQHEVFFLANDVVPDRDGSWENVTVVCRVGVQQGNDGPEAGAVYVPWNASFSSEVFSCRALEKMLEQFRWNLSSQVEELRNSLAVTQQNLEGEKNAAFAAKQELATAQQAAAMAEAAVTAAKAELASWKQKQLQQQQLQQQQQQHQQQQWQQHQQQAWSAPAANTGSAGSAAATAGVPQPPAPVTWCWHDDWLKTGWLNKAVALSGAVRTKNVDRLEELVQKLPVCREECNHMKTNP